MALRSNERKRPFGATFRTLNDVTNTNSLSRGGGTGYENDDADDNGENGKINIQHIPSLPNAEGAAAMLRRIRSEFRTIVERRGWNVVSVTEMCCCGDGIDFLSKATSKNKRTTRTMPDNVLGYNRTSSYSRSRGGKVHDIHLRLRRPRTHELLDYESVAGTMCHELAHCVRGPHDAKFYKAMEEIEEQYAVYLAKGVVVDRDGFPIGSSESHVLGSASGGTHVVGRGGGGSKKNRFPADRRKVLDAAESRRKKGNAGLTQGRILGGKSSSSSKDPREAARIAAERRFLDARYCLPCNEIIEILGEDPSDDEGDDEVEVLNAANDVPKTAVKSDRTKGKLDANEVSDAKPKPKIDSSASGNLIDLTLDDSIVLSPVAIPKPAKKSKSKTDPGRTARLVAVRSKWACPRCSLDNPEIILVCEACHLERPCRRTALGQVNEFNMEEDTAYIKEREVAQSKETFGGFNIYGEKKNASSTMKHLT